MEKKIHFIAGLPRSGSTLLCNILNQNPRFHATATSGILDIILAIRNQWENVDTLRAAPNKVGKDAVVKGILPAYFNDVDKPIVFDKSRAWPAYLELAEFILGYEVKVLVPVRDIVDVLCSFEQLYRRNAHNWQFPQEKSHFAQFQTIQGRADIFMRSEQPVGIAYNRIRDAMGRGFGDRMAFVEFEGLTTRPEAMMKAVYDFLGEEHFTHDFDNVEQSTSENDDIHGIPGLHVIRNQVKPVKSNALEVLGEEVYEKYKDAQFWR